MNKKEIIESRLEHLYEIYSRLKQEMDDLVVLTNKEAYYISSKHWGCKIVLIWVKCGRETASKCPWCLGTRYGGHGPYWVKMVFSTNKLSRSSSGASGKKWLKTIRLKGITHQSLKDAFTYEDSDGVLHKCTHSRGYSVLHPLDVRKKEIAQKLKIVKDALNCSESKMRYAEMRLSKLGVK